MFRPPRTWFMQSISPEQLPEYTALGWVETARTTYSGGLYESVLVELWGRPGMIAPPTPDEPEGEYEPVASEED